MDDLVESVDWGSVEVLGDVVDTGLQILVALVEKVLLSAALSIVARRDKKWIIVFNVSQGVQNLEELLATSLFLRLLTRLVKDTICIAHG